MKTSKLSLLALAVAGLPATASQLVYLHDNQAAMQDLLAEFNAGSQIQSLAGGQRNFIEHKVSDDGKHRRYHQYHNGIRVFGGEIITHDTKRNVSSQSGRPNAISGSLVTGLQVNTNKAIITAQQANRIAKAKYQRADFFASEESELLYYPFNGSYRLVYQISFFTDSGNGPTRPVFYIDALNGAILDQYEQLNTLSQASGPGGNAKIGKYEFGVDKGYLQVTDLG